MSRAKDTKEPVAGPSTSHAMGPTQKEGAPKKPEKDFDGVSPDDTSKTLDTKTCVYGPEQAYQQHSFDYVDHMEFNRLQLLLSQVQLMKDAKPNVPNCVEEPSREVLMKKFTEMYGPVDYESPKMELILQQMKESVMEQQELDYNQIITQLWEEGIQTCGPADAEAQLKALISQKFDQKKQQSYSTFNPREASGEWFVLPRGDPAEVRRRNFQGVPHFTRTYVLEEPPDPLMKKEAEKEPEESVSEAYKKMLVAPHQPLPNLHLYDPKFEFCFQRPYRIFRKDVVGHKSLGEIPKMVSLRILEHLNNFPLGVSPKYFWESYYDSHRRLPFYQMTPSQVLRHHQDEIWFVNEFIKDFTAVAPSRSMPELMFPGFLENVVDSELILKRVWHAINCVMGRQFFVSSEDLFALIQDIYSIKFHRDDWGFNSDEKFILFCNTKFGASHLASHRVTVTQGGVVRRYDYIVINTDYWKRHVEHLHPPDGKVKNFALTHGPSSYVNYMIQGHTIDAVANHCKEFGELDCELTSVPKGCDAIFLVQRSQMDKLQTFMKNLQNHKDVLRSLRKSVSKNTIKVSVGSYMLALIDIGETSFWYRVRVIGKNEDLFQVYAIDYGIFHEVPIKNLSYLPQGEISGEPSFAIPVILDLPGRSDMRRTLRKCDHQLKKVISDLSRGKHLRVKLVEGIFSKTLGTSKWTAECSVVTTDCNNQIKYEDFPGVVTQRFHQITRGHNEKMSMKVVKRTKEVGEKKERSVDDEISGLKALALDKMAENVVAENVDSKEELDEEKLVAEKLNDKEEEGEEKVVTGKAEEEVIIEEPVEDGESTNGKPVVAKLVGEESVIFVAEDTDSSDQFE